MFAVFAPLFAPLFAAGPIFATIDHQVIAASTRSSLLIGRILFSLLNFPAMAASSRHENALIGGPAAGGKQAQV
jgi:hypothetical protein